VEWADGPMSLVGLLLSFGALGCDAAFTLLAVPLIAARGARAVSAYACLFAVPLLLLSGLALDGRDVLPLASLEEAGALAYMAVIVSAVAFRALVFQRRAARGRTSRTVRWRRARQRSSQRNRDRRVVVHIRPALECCDGGSRRHHGRGESRHRVGQVMPIGARCIGRTDHFVELVSKASELAHLATEAVEEGKRAAGRRNAGGRARAPAQGPVGRA
jgi:hypothetical protein